MNHTDPYHLDRFLRVQEWRGTYRQALIELRAGKKVGHWIWFVMPRLIGPGYSTTSEYYAIGSRWEARAYLRHPTLGTRLVECVRAVLAARGRTLVQIFGPVDAAKVRQCA